MKKSNLWLGACAILAFGSFMTSCSDDDEPTWDDSGSKVDLPNDRMFILNAGSYGDNNSNVSLYDIDGGTVVDDLFYKQNGQMLGDTGQDIIEYDDHIYVAVYGSNYLSKLNAAGVEEARQSFASDSELQGGVRYIAAENGYIYASFHGGVVAKINASSLAVEKKITNLGANLEGVAIENGNLYVANSYSVSVNPDTGRNVYTYLDEMFVINLSSFTLSSTSTLTVATNPNQVLEEDDKVFLIGWGNYGSIGYQFQMIEPKNNNKITTLATATMMAAGNDIVYLVNSETDWSTYTTTNTFTYYDIKNGKYVDSTFLNNAPEELGSASIYMMAVDDENGDIYIGTSDYVTNGDIYRFSSNGTYVTKFDSGGINPCKAVFLDKH